MNKLFGTLLGLSLMTLGACNSSTEMQTIVLENPLSSARKDAVIQLQRSQFSQHTEKNDYVIFTTNQGDTIPCQYDDLDNDGLWDELVMMCDFEAKETKSLKMKWFKADHFSLNLPKRTNIRYGKMVKQGQVVDMSTDSHDKHLLWDQFYPYQLDGPTWENDKVAFRQYFDGRNSKDVFAKLTPNMVMDTVGITDEGSIKAFYTKMCDWGTDVLTVGRSFGLGGIALAKSDSLYRLGIMAKAKNDVIDSTRYTLIKEGPLRSKIKINYYGWNIGEDKVDIEETVTIYAGQYGFESRIVASNLPQGSNLVTGMVNIENTKPLYDKEYAGKYKIMATHDLQANGKKNYMGLSLVVPYENVVNLFEASDMKSTLKNTTCVNLKPDHDNGYSYYAFACCDMTDKQFQDRTYFLSYMEDRLERMANPIIVKMK